MIAIYHQQNLVCLWNTITWPPTWCCLIKERIWCFMEESFWDCMYIGINRTKGLPGPFLHCYYLIIPNLGQYLGLYLKFSILYLALLKCVMLLSSFLLFARAPLSCSSDLQRCAGMTLFWAWQPIPFHKQPLMVLSLLGLSLLFL